MELFLNLAWLAVTGVLLCLWLLGGGRDRTESRPQLIAMVVLITILFPVISVSDDLLAIQNASEVDNYLRRAHLLPAHANPVQPMLAVVALAIFAGIGFGFARFNAPSLLPVKEPSRPEIAGIENRPPPVALIPFLAP